MVHARWATLQLVGALLLLLAVLSACSSQSSFASASAAAAPASGSSVLGRPSLSVAFLARVLAAYHSPASDAVQALYDDGVAVGVDPAYALAFFLHESSMGTQGVARVTRSPGNLRCTAAYSCYEGYACFSTWADGFHAWYVLISGPVYAGAGLVTIEQIIPRYAPATENDVQAYIQAVNLAVATWRSGRVLV